MVFITILMKKLLIFLLVFFFSVHNLWAQELKCNVQIVTQKIQGTNKKIFKTLQRAIVEFMNNHKWTNHVYDNDERIECNLLINLSEEISSDEFKGTIQVQARRPIYNSSYNTVMFNYLDNDFHFRYIEYEPLVFNETAYVSSLTSILAYYAYIILGLDYDSFSFEGGTEFFQKAEIIVQNAQNAREKGWKAFESRRYNNRYWLVENIMNEKFNPVREFLYKYHRLGLDLMDSKVNEGRAEIAESLKLLQKVYREKPDPFMHLLQVIYNAKADEFVNIFSESYTDEKNRVFEVLKEIDPANTAKYQKMMN